MNMPEPVAERLSQWGDDLGINFEPCLVNQLRSVLKTLLHINATRFQRYRQRLLLPLPEQTSEVE